MFVDLPIKKKFVLFGVGALFWFVCMATLTVLAQTAILYKYHQASEKITPHRMAVASVLEQFNGLEQDLRSALDLDNGQDAAALASARAHIQSIRSTTTALSLRQSEAPTGGTIVETLVRSLATTQQQHVQYLQALTAFTDQIDRDTDAFIAQQRQAEPNHPSVINAHTRVQAQIDQARALAAQHAKHMEEAYSTVQGQIHQIIRHSVNATLLVLLLASVLLLVFVRWIIVAFERPIATIVQQIDQLATGDIDRAQKVAVYSRDEIGTLSEKFNHLVGNVYNMTVYKKVIEDDATLDEVYRRLGDVFENELGINGYAIYDVSTQKKEMRLAYPPRVGEHSQLPCDPDILSDCTQCRAVKTGHPVSSFEFPGICRRFVPQDGVGHICIPLMAGGVTSGVVQLRFAADERGGSADPSMPLRRFKAATYINQSLSVIEAKRLMQTLRESAMIDPLTGLYNRRFLQEHTKQLISGVLRRKLQVGLLLCDLDYFKQVNDTHGHDAGDQLLRETSLVLKSSVRDSDIVIRFGGEEFLVLLLDVQPGDAMQVAEKIRQNIEKMKVVVGDRTLQKTISIGAAEFPGDSDGFWQAIKYADVALYQAKEQGRNRVLRFEPEMWQGQV